MFESAHNLEGNGAVLPFGEGRPERRTLEPGALLERRGVRSPVPRETRVQSAAREVLGSRLQRSVHAARRRLRTLSSDGARVQRSCGGSLLSARRETFFALSTVVYFNNYGN